MGLPESPATEPINEMMTNCERMGAAARTRRRTGFVRSGLWLALSLASSALCFEPARAAEPSAAAAPARAPAAAPGTAPDDLRVGDRPRPLNVEGKPSFSWLPHDPGGDQVQSARQIQVWRDGSTALVWDSGKVRSSQQSHVEYAGAPLRPATAYRWKVRTWNRADAASEWSAAGAFDTALAPGEPGWGAHWIRRATADAADAADEYTLARVEQPIAASPIRRARAYVSASHQFELRVGGRIVDRGPAFAYPGEGYYQASDLTPLVQPGQPLVLGALYHWYGAGQGRPAGAPGLLVRVVIEHEDGSREVIVSDSHWRLRRASQWQTGAPRRNSDVCDYVEWIDARQALDGWDRPGYDASGWQAPVLAPFVAVRGQEPRLTTTEVRPVSVKTFPGGAIVADFGKVMPARPRVRFANGVAGRVLNLRAGYRLMPDGAVSAAPDATQGTDLSFRFVQRDGAQEFLPQTHFGWRYLELSAPGEKLGPEAFSALVEHTDAPLDRGAEFESSDPTLNAVFELTKRSALYAVQQQFVDTPTREKGQFLQDAANISFATMAAWRERDATQKAIDEFVASQARYWPDGRVNAVYPNGDGGRDIPDFTLMLPVWVWRYHVETGDLALLRRAYPALAKIAAYAWHYRDGSTGLITRLAGGKGPYENGIVDWPPSGRFDYDRSQAALTTVNEMAVAALRSTAAVGAALGRADAAEHARRADQLSRAINERLRSGSLYVDGATQGQPSAHLSQHANSLALALGIVPSAERDAVATYVASLGMRQGPMTAHWLAQALASTDRYEALLALLTNPMNPGWARVLGQGGTFTWESWDAASSGQTESESHGWGSQVIVDILETLLGVRIISPGAAVVGIRPPPSGLKFARGRVHTERGPVRVAWSRQGTSGLDLTIDVPMNVRAEVTLPAADAAKATASGAGAPRLKQGTPQVTYEVGSGESRFTLR